MAKKKYWMTPLGEDDDFGHKFGDTMYDGKTIQGPWANMSENSWRAYGIGKLGLGCGQKYEKQADGRWLKVDG